MIEIRHLFKSFGDKNILTDITLDVNEGETLCIIGKSGCGKSVLLKLIVGLLSPDNGDVLVDGSKISELRQRQLFDVRKRIGYVFQGAALFDSYNVFENTILKLIENGEKDMIGLENEAKRVLSAVGLLPNLDDESLLEKEWRMLSVKKPSELSGGMKKRVGVARALVGSPDYIFYDEPTTGLDPVTSEQIDTLIAHLANTLKTTSIVITHDMFSVYNIADKVAMLHEGDLHFNGTIDAIRQTTDVVVREFVNRYS